MSQRGDDPVDGSTIRPVAPDQWSIVGWLWQAYRQDMAEIVSGLPYPDGRYQWGELRRFPSEDTSGYLAWRPHPNTGEPAPVGFSLVEGLAASRRSITAFWVAPVLRRGRLGMTLALHTIEAHPGPWAIAFQHENPSAGAFWRRVADEAFGEGAWVEDERPVPGKGWLPPDHWIQTR